MKRKRLQRRTTLICVLSIVVLSLALLPAWMCALGGPSEETGPPTTPGLATNSGNHGNQSALEPPGTQLAPSAPRWPFLRFIAVLCSGLLISAARLARKFRRFWGLGVFTNPYGVLFLIAGAGISGIPLTSESHLSSIHFIGSAGPWIADVSGILAALVLTGIHFRSKVPPPGDSQVRDLESAPSSNAIVAVIEDAIRDHILERMQSEVVAASRRYDWDTIKLAARRALAEEMAIRPLAREDYEAARQSIENFQAEVDSRLDSRNKYEALVGLLRWCSFKRLIRGLNTAANEPQS